MNSTGKIFTVTELNSFSKKILEDNFPSVLVEGEVSKITFHSSGHMYFTIKDEDAAVDCVMYRGYGSKINFKPQRGMSVLIKGQLSIYVRGGRYQLIAWTMTEKGLGMLEQRFLELKRELLKEGLFDESIKKPIPAVPSLIGIITSPTGAAIRDILNIAERRFSGIKTVIYPATVQGSKAAQEISKGLKTLNIMYSDMDVIIVTRGGGSLEDLWPFNEESVARAIHASKIPVVSAVGHEIDFTISDFAADLRAPTPSAAAELVIADRKILIEKLSGLVSHIHNSINRIISLMRERYLASSESPVFRYPLRIFEERQQDIDHVSSHIVKNIKYFISSMHSFFDTVSGSFKALSPKATLERGYSITYSPDLKSIITDATKLKNGDTLKTVLYKGTVTSRISKTEV
ncbi:MAG: exodeoxyribonuclease VII large subunit [Elusimicrobiota bacterium]